MKKSYDFAVIGAGVFGAWIAHYLRRSGASIALLDKHGPGNSRASSGGETRVIRMGYGPDELYTLWSLRSLPVWKEFAARWGREIFHRTGVLWLSNDSDSYTRSVCQILANAGVTYEKLEEQEIRTRYPQLAFSDITWGVLEPESGVLMARGAVQELVRELVREGVDYSIAHALAPEGSGTLELIRTSDGDVISAGTFVFSCGPWLPKVFPDVLGNLIFPTRQEVFFLGPPAACDDFGPGKMPVWLHHTHPERPYALPDIEGRGFKIAFDRHGAEFDPETGTRIVRHESIQLLRDYLRSHIPGLCDAPIVETRVCQYENTWNGDFLVDRHPAFANVWIVGGGSGHGFKHGPAMGEYVSARIVNNAAEEPRFSLASKQAIQQRAVY